MIELRARHWAVIAQALAVLARSGKVTLAQRALASVNELKNWEFWLWYKTHDRWVCDHHGRWM